jgi:hypothetical protein
VEAVVKEAVQVSVRAKCTGGEQSSGDEGNIVEQRPPGDCGVAANE